MGRRVTLEEESKLITKQVMIVMRFTEKQYEKIKEIARDFDIVDD